MQMVLIHGVNNVAIPVPDRLVSWRSAMVQGGTTAARIDASPDYWMG
jgi:hypothetical protein